MRRLFILLFTTSAFLTFSCKSQTDNIKAGSICTVETGKGKFGVVKILVINEEEAHIKVYRNKYSERPVAVDIKELSMGSMADKNGFGIGHIPLDRKGFDNSNPVIVGFEEVTKADLTGYEIWKNQ